MEILQTAAGGTLEITERNAKTEADIFLWIKGEKHKRQTQVSWRKKKILKKSETETFFFYSLISVVGKK